MKKVITAVGIVVLFLHLQSCDKQEEQLIPDETNSEVTESFIIPESIIKVNNRTKKILSKKRDVFNTKWRRVTRQDLQNFRDEHGKKTFLNSNGAKNKFTFILNKGNRRPWSVSINDTQIGYKGINYNNRAGSFAEFRASGRLIEDKDTKLTKWTPVEGMSAFVDKNRDRKEKFMSSPGKWTASVRKGTTLTVTGENTVTNGITLNIGTLLSVEESESFSLTKSEEKLLLKIISQELKSSGIWVPAGKCVRFTPVERHRINKVKWKFPLEFKGKVSADFGSKKHQGRHYWTVNAHDYFYDYTKRDRKFIVNIDDEVAHEFGIRAEIVNSKDKGCKNL